MSFILAHFLDTAVTDVYGWMLVVFMGRSPIETSTLDSLWTAIFFLK